MAKLVLIDGKSVFYRGYYAMSYLTVSDGTPVGGVYGFMVLALNIIKDLKPDYLAVCWDKSKTNIAARKKIYPDYKANRQPAPAEFYDQVPILLKLLKSFNWPLYQFDNYEADDIMATLAALASRQKQLTTVLVSSDLDMLQLLDKRVQFYAIKKNLKQVDKFDPASFEIKYGIRVDQFVDYKALMGDSSDNIPGVAGIGPKAAAELLQLKGSLEAVYRDLDQLPVKYQNKLQAGRKMAFISRQLIELKRDAPVKLDLEQLALTNLDPARLLKNLRQLEFYSLIKQLPAELLQSEEVGFSQPQLSRLRFPRVNLKAGPADFAAVDWSKNQLLAVYCRDRFGQDLDWLLVASDSQTANLYDRASLAAIKASYKWPKSLKIWGYDCQRLVAALIGLGADSQNIKVVWDIKLIGFLLEPGRRQQSLTALANHYLDYSSELDQQPAADFADLAPERLAVITGIRAKQRPALNRLSRLKQLALEIELPFIPVLAKLELAGLVFEAGRLTELNQELIARIGQFEQLIYDYAGARFNIASPAQLSRVLYNDLKLPTSGIARARLFSWRTDADQLNKLRSAHPIIDCLIGWRELTKLKSTYVDALPKHQDPDGRIRSQLQQTTAVTGRLASQQPNLQNIPNAGGLGKVIRSAFVAPEGYCLISADYSQFELRLAAVLANEPELIGAFLNDQDIHSTTAQTVFGVKPGAVTAQQRLIAKTINFGVLYGQGPHSLAAGSGISYQQAAGFIDDYFAKRPALAAYMDQIKRQIRDIGYVETLFGRRRYFPEIKTGHQNIIQAAERQAVNFPIQGTEADLMKKAMIDLDGRLPPAARMILQVHDSILLECRQDSLEPVTALVKDCLESVYPELEIPLKVVIKTGPDWAAVS